MNHGARKQVNAAQDKNEMSYLLATKTTTTTSPDTTGNGWLFIFFAGVTHVLSFCRRCKFESEKRIVEIFLAMCIELLPLSLSYQR